MSRCRRVLVTWKVRWYTTASLFFILAGSGSRPPLPRPCKQMLLPSWTIIHFLVFCFISDLKETYSRKSCALSVFHLLTINISLCEKLIDAFFLFVVFFCFFCCSFCCCFFLGGWVWGENDMLDLRRFLNTKYHITAGIEANLTHNSPMYLGWNLAWDFRRIFPIKLRNFKLRKMPKLLNFRFPNGWYFLNCDSTKLKRSSVFFMCPNGSAGRSGLTYN